jgi:hypothetical protein
MLALIQFKFMVFWDVTPQSGTNISDGSGASVCTLRIEVTGSPYTLLLQGISSLKTKVSCAHLS